MYVLVLVIILIIGVGVYWQVSRTYEFGGSVTSISGNMVMATGNLTIKSAIPLGNKSQEVTISIDTTGASLSRTALHIPANTQSFNTEDLKQETGATTLDVVTRDVEEGAHLVGIEGMLKKSGDGYKAKSLIFRVPVFE